MDNFINNTNQPFTVVTNDLLQQKTIFKNATQKLCYLYLYSLKNFKRIFPSHESIADAACCSIATVKRTLSELEKLGLLEVKRRKGYTNIYILKDYSEVAQIELSDVEETNDAEDEVVQNELAQNELDSDQNELGIVQNELLKVINKKNINKSNKLTVVNKETSDNLAMEYMKKGLPKRLALKVVDEVNEQRNIKDYGAYLRTCLETTLIRYNRNRDLSEGFVPENTYKEGSLMRMFHEVIYEEI